MNNPVNDNPRPDTLVAWFRVREGQRHFIVERRTTGADSLRHESLWHELLRSTDRGVAERFCSRAAVLFGQRHVGAVVRIESLPAQRAPVAVHAHSSARA